MFWHCSHFWKKVKPRSKFIRYVLLVNHEIVLIPGVKWPVTSYLQYAEAFRDLEMAWNMHFVLIVYRHLKHDKPSNIRQNYTFTMTNQPSGGAGSSVFVLLFACLYLHGYKKFYKGPEQLYMYQNFDSTPYIEEFIGVWKIWRTYPALPYTMFNLNINYIF